MWGCVTSTVTGNLVKVDGRLNSTRYQQQILDKNETRVGYKVEARPWLDVSAGQ